MQQFESRFKDGFGVTGGGCIAHGATRYKKQGKARQGKEENDAAHGFKKWHVKIRN